MTHFLVSSMSLAKDFSQQYILITLMPFRISFMSLILLSVLLAVSSLSLPNCFPTQTETYNRQLKLGSFSFKLTLKRDKSQEECHPHESAGSDPLVEKVRHDTQLERTRPEVVALYHGRVEPAHVVGQKVHHLADGCLGHRTFGEFQGFPVDKRRAGDPHPHPDKVDPIEVGVVDESVQSRHQHHTTPIQIGLQLADLNSGVGSTKLEVELETE